MPDPWYWNGTKLQRPGNEAARKFEASRAAFAHDSHKEGDGDEAAAIEQNTEVVESNGIEVVSRLGIEPRTRRLRERMASVHWCPRTVFC